MGRFVRNVLCSFELNFPLSVKVMINFNREWIEMWKLDILNKKSFYFENFQYV